MSFNQLMIHYCAPTLCDIKPGNIFFVRNRDFSQSCFEEWKNTFLILGFMTFAIKLSKDSTAIFVCNPCWERKILGDSMVQAYLHEKGYHDCGVTDFVKHFKIRLQTAPGFPHEIGIVLGYPVNDVIEFENHEGQNCKYCGYWKSYSDIENAKQCHCEYKNCSGLCERLYNEGYSLDFIIREYKKVAAAA